MSWTQLPSEIVLQIIDILDIDLIQFRLVCQSWFRHTYDFPYKQFRVTSNVIDFVNGLATLPYHPGDLVKKITFTDEFAQVDLDGQLATIVKSIFHYCPHLELIHCSTLARGLIWPWIIEEANHSLRKVKYVGDHIFPKLCKTEEETELLYVHVMYALRDSIRSLYLFNDDPRSLFPVYEAFRKKLKHFKALDMLRLYGCFTLEELNAIMDNCQTMTTLVIYSAIDSSCLYGPMVMGHIKPHTQLKYLQVHTCSSLEVKGLSYIVEKFQNLTCCTIDRMNLSFQEINQEMEAFIRFGMRIHEFSVKFWDMNNAIHTLYTCLHMSTALSIHISLCISTKLHTNYLGVQKKSKELTIQMRLDELSLSIYNVDMLCQLLEQFPIDMDISGRMKNKETLDYLNNKIKASIELV